MPAATADEIDARLPDAASRAAAQEGAPAPWSATPISSASSSRRSPAEGRRPRWSNTIKSVNVADCISDVTAWPRIQMFVASDVAIAVRQGSIGAVIIPAGLPAGACYGNATVTL